MPVSPRIKNISRQLVALSMADDQVSAERVTAILNSLDAKPPRNYRAVLIAYRKYLRRELEKRQARVEYAGPFDESVESGLAQHFSSLYGRPVEVVASENPELIAGLRVRVADDVYETSLRQRLDRLARTV